MSPPLPIACLHVGPRYNNGPTLVEDGTDAILAYGYDAAGYFMSPNAVTPLRGDGRLDYPGQDWGGTPTTLTQLAQTTGFQHVWASALARIYIKTWTFANGVSLAWGPYASIEQTTAEYDELKAFCIWLLQNTSGKDFFIQTSESDFDYLGGVDLDAFITNTRSQRVIDFFDARIRAVRDARREAGPSTSRIFSVIECNRVLDSGRRLHRDIFPHIDPDYISFSIYEAIHQGWYFEDLDQAGSRASIDLLMRKVMARTTHAIRRARGPAAANKLRFFLGEWGFPEAQAKFAAHNLDVAGFVDQVLATAADLGIVSANFWQLWCNDIGPAGGLPPGDTTDQAMQRENNSLTGQGTRILELLA